MPDGGFAQHRLIKLPSPFSLERVEGLIEEGLTIQQIVDRNFPEEGKHYRVLVWVSDPDMAVSTTLIPRAYWKRVRPIKGAVVTLRVVPMGGGGGGGKSPLRTILTLAVVVAAAAVTWGVSSYLGAGVVGKAGAAATWAATSSGLTFAGTLAAGAAGALVGFVGNLLVNAVAPPPAATLPDFNSASFNGTSTTPTLSITGIQNRANQYGAIPRVFGRVRMFPPLGAVPYTEIVGSDQYLRMLFCFGYGPLEISEMKIGTIALDQYEGVEYELRQGFDDDEPITLYANTVNEDSYSIQLKYNVPRTIVSRTGINEFTLDLSFEGLVTFTETGERSTNSVDIKLEYRKVGDVAWIDNGTTTISAATEQLYRYSFRQPDLDEGQYEVRLTRLTADSTSTRVRSDCSVSVFRSITYSPPNVDPGLCLLALRIKTSNQLNGIIQEFNAVAQALLPVYDPDTETWSDPVATRSPAWAAAEVLRGAANAKAMADSRLNLDSWADFADFCARLDQNGEAMFCFDTVVEQRTTVHQMLKTILGTARATYSRDSNGRYSIIIDKDGKPVSQLFTPRNSWGFKGKKVFVDAPHALRTRYIEPEREWQQHEILVYNDGYDATNATEFEVIEFVGVTRSSQAWRDARTALANGILRPEVYELYTDMEYLACQKGSLVRVAHDVPRWGLGQARVKTLIMDGDLVSGITIDASVAVEFGKSYGIRARKSDNTQVDVTLQAPVSSAALTTLTFNSPKDTDDAPDVGDLIAFGELNRVTADFIVKNIFSAGDINARLELVDAAPAIFTADTGPIPTFDTQSTWAASGALFDIPKPIIVETRSDEEAMFRTANGFVPAVRVTFGPRSGITTPGDYIEAQVRRFGSGEAWRPFPPFFGAPSIIYLTPIDDGAQYDFRFRYVRPTGKASEWTLLTEYTAQGRIAPPPNVLTATIHNGNLVWDYPDPPNDLAGFKVLWSAGSTVSDASAVLAHAEGSVVTSPFPMSAFPPGAITIFIYAVDTAGNVSSDPAILMLSVGDPEVGNIVETIDLKALSFPGTRPNTSISDGNLKSDVSTQFWNDDASLFWNDDASLFWPVTAYFDMEYEFSITPSEVWLPVAMTLDLTIDASSYTVEYRKRGTSPFWGIDGDTFWPDDADDFWADVNAWLPWPGSVDVTRETVDVRITAQTGAANTQIVISELAAVFDVPDVTEQLLDVTLLAAGSRLAITKDYRVIKTVNVDIVENGSGAVSWQIIDRDADLGPMIKVFNSAGTGVAGKINARIEGY